MKKRLLYKFLSKAFLLLLFFSATQLTFSQTSKPFSRDESPLPEPTGYVNDYADVIDAATEQRIEEQIKEFRKTSNPPVEIAVAVVKTTEGRAIFDYSLAVARGWGIGSKDDDNPSALLFVAIDDRKYFTQVSRDLEDELPDGLVGSLQRQYLIPEFKKGNYGKGIEDTIDAYIRTIKQKQTGEPITNDQSEPGGTTDIFNERDSSRGSSICNTFICLIVLFIILFIVFSRGGGGKNNRRGGGGGSGGSGVGSAILWAVLSGLASGSSGSSSSSSGGWSGGGGSSGGWGGFGGGGDFGGGGAGGSW